jgi:hypothetical protein
MESNQDLCNFRKRENVLHTALYEKILKISHQ